jgi:hypothetical protein
MSFSLLLVLLFVAAFKRPLYKLKGKKKGKNPNNKLDFLRPFFHIGACAADFQKDWFKRQPGMKKEFVRTGFYYWCQYPNYFGEIAVWWTMYFWCGFPNLAFSHPYILLSPIFTTYLLRYGSGVANLSYYQGKSYGHREDYREYVAKTPLLLPFMKPFYVNNVAQPAPAVEEPLVSGENGNDETGAGTSGAGATNES